jgi:hypothetical protein
VAHNWGWNFHVLMLKSLTMVEKFLHFLCGLQLYYKICFGPRIMIFSFMVGFHEENLHIKFTFDLNSFYRLSHAFSKVDKQ